MMTANVTCIKTDEQSGAVPKLLVATECSYQVNMDATYTRKWQKYVPQK
jgi:hypothetical protein